MYGNIIKTKCYSEVNIINTSLTYLAVTITDHKPLVHLFNNAQLRMLKDGDYVYKNLILQLVTLKVQLIQLISCYDIRLTQKKQN